MFDIVFLGTSASAPSVERGLSSALLMHRDQRFLLDCGEGTQRQLIRSGMGFRKIDKVLLTHGHLDHILGLGGLVSTFSRWESIDTLSLYGGHWALQRVHDLMNVVLRGGEAEMEIHYHPVNAGVIWQNQHLQVSAFPVNHRGPGCFGYLFQEPSHRPFIPEIADALGVPRGPERKQLVQGSSITLADGRLVHPDEVLGPAEAGVKVVHVGDAGSTADLVPYCAQADALVIEATYTSAEEAMAAQFGHLTAAQSARLAAEAGVGALFLVHLSRRYSEREILREARAIFPNTFVPCDLECYRVGKGFAERVEVSDGLA
ncbi:MAG: ribonuclease Z [Chloroflexi bacterium]|nr:ribonuclease Z [Chloroflexota bacterium]